MIKTVENQMMTHTGSQTEKKTMLRSCVMLRRRKDTSETIWSVDREMDKKYPYYSPADLNISVFCLLTVIV